MTERPIHTNHDDECAACHRPFDPTDDRHDGRAQYRDTPWCCSCIDRCHDSESADHRCPVCFTYPTTSVG
jgi:hypothetical protein